MKIITSVSQLKINNIYLLITSDEMGQENANGESLIHADQMVLTNICDEGFYTFKGYDRKGDLELEVEFITTYYITHGKLIDAGEFNTWK